jgi:hypothetical protein
LSHVQGHEVPVQDVIASLGEPERVATRAAANVSHDRGRRWQVPQDDLFRTLEFKLSACFGEPLPFVPLIVVLPYRRGIWVIGHGQTMPPIRV